MQRALAVHPRGQWPEDRTVDTATLVYLDRHRRRIRLVADSGAAFLLDLPRAQHLADGDGLELDGGGYVKVCAAPEAVIVEAVGGYVPEEVCASAFGSKPADRLWSPTATAMVTLGACISVMTALAQVYLKEAWLRVEAGPRAGRYPGRTRPGRR